MEAYVAQAGFEPASPAYEADKETAPLPRYDVAIRVGVAPTSPARDGALA